MSTRADQLSAHRYAMRRVVNAVVSHDPDPTGPARPRSSTLALAGVVIATVASAGVLVYGTLTGQGSPSTLRDSSTVLIERETGAQYVYTKSDGLLHPVLNYASGRLLTDGTATSPTTVRRKRLAKLRQDSGLGIGAPLGIPDAPDALPAQGELLNDVWQVCTRTPGGTENRGPHRPADRRRRGLRRPRPVIAGAGWHRGGDAGAGPGSTDVPDLREPKILHPAAGRRAGRARLDRPAAQPGSRRMAQRPAGGLRRRAPDRGRARRTIERGATADRTALAHDRCRRRLPVGRWYAAAACSPLPTFKPGCCRPTNAPPPAPPSR